MVDDVKAQAVEVIRSLSTYTMTTGSVPSAAYGKGVDPELKWWMPAPESISDALAEAGLLADGQWEPLEGKLWCMADDHVLPPGFKRHNKGKQECPGPHRPLAVAVEPLLSDAFHRVEVDPNVRDSDGRWITKSDGLSMGMTVMLHEPEEGTDHGEARVVGFSKSGKFVYLEPASAPAVAVEAAAPTTALNVEMGTNSGVGMVESVEAAAPAPRYTVDRAVDGFWWVKRDGVNLLRIPDGYPGGAEAAARREAAALNEMEDGT